jgi:sugar phosphate isomerase/epimerase
MNSLPLYMASIHLPMKDDWAACITKAAETGFDGIELTMKYEEGGSMEKSRLEFLAKTARDHSLRLSAHPWMDWVELPLEQAREKLRRLLEYCVVLEMREVNIHLGFLANRDQGVERLFSITDPVIPFLAEHGVTLLFENVPSHNIRELGSEAGDFDRLFTHYDQETPVMMTIDTGHAHIEKIIEALAGRWGSRWRYTHVHDNDGREDRHWRPGQGAIGWKALAALMERIGYHGPLMMEYDFIGLPEAMPVLTDALAVGNFSIRPLRIGVEE